jgi:hypothetical protein
MFTRCKSYISGLRSAATKESSRTIVVTALAIGLLLVRVRCCKGRR